MTDRPAPPTLTAFAWTLLVTLGVIWGAAFFFARVAVDEVLPLTLVLYRVSIAAVTLHVILAVLGRSIHPYVHRWRDFLVLGLLNNAVPFSLLFAGQTALSAGLASILNATMPIWTVVIGHVLTSDERMSAHKVAGVALGFVGVATMLGPAATGVLTAPAWAMLCVIGGAMSYGFAVVFAKRFSAMPPLVTATGQLTASSALMLPVVLVIDGVPEVTLSGETWAAIAALAVISTALAYILYFRVLAIAGAVNGSLVTLLVPPSAILLGWLFLSERLDAFAWMGLALIGSGLVVLDGRLLQKLRG